MPLSHLVRCSALGGSALAVVSLAVFASCGKTDEAEESKETGESGGTIETKFALNTLNLKPQLAGTEVLRAGPTSGSTVSLAAGSAFGQSSLDGYTSAKFRVSSMVLCGDVNEAGGDSCGANPWTLYTEPASTGPDYNGFVPSVADAFSGWTDFLDKASTDKLAAKATYSDVHVGSYEAVIVGFYRAFKIKASVPMSDGMTLYTKASKDYRDNGKSGLDVTYTSVTPDMTTAPAEDATMFLPNGGKTFYLQSKFEITADDIKNKTAFKMVLAYDPNNAIKGTKAGDGYFQQSFLEGQLDQVHGYLITAPFMEFSPVLARQSETIMRETYLVTIPPFALDPNGPKAAGAVRLSLYYVKEDATKAVRGITSTLVYTSDTTNSFSINPLGQIRKVVTNAEGGVDMMYNPTLAAVKGFKRLTETGTTGTVDAKVCLGGMSGGTCEAAAERSLTLKYTLLGSGNVDDALAVDYVPPVPTASPAP